MIEKAYKKLRLDALVIQQGRLQDNAAAKVGLEPLGAMLHTTARKEASQTSHAWALLISTI